MRNQIFLLNLTSLNQMFQSLSPLLILTHHQTPMMTLIKEIKTPGMMMTRNRRILIKRYEPKSIYKR
jgi:hypothetical protein